MCLLTVESRQIKLMLDTFKEAWGRFLKGSLAEFLQVWLMLLSVSCKKCKFGVWRCHFSGVISSSIPAYYQMFGLQWVFWTKEYYLCACRHFHHLHIVYRTITELLCTISFLSLCNTLVKLEVWLLPPATRLSSIYCWVDRDLCCILYKCLNLVCNIQHITSCVNTSK